MFLYYYILIASSIISITCSERASNQAISSQSYNRGDVPLSYKNNFIHIYTSPVPHALNHSPHENKHYNQQKLHQIQYAPLPLRTPEEHSNKTGRYTEISGYNNANDKKISPLGQEKNNIEPKIVNTQASNYDLPRLPYVTGVSGHNLIFQALKNRLVQSGLNVNNANLLKNKQVKTLQPQINYERPEGIQSLPQNFPLSVTEKYLTPNQIYSVLAEQYVPSAKKYNEDIPSGVENVDRLPIYFKAPKVQLNIARSHIIAHAPHKASVKVNSNFKKLDALPADFFFNAQMIQPKNTKIIPAQKRNIFLIHRSV